MRLRRSRGEPGRLEMRLSKTGKLVAFAEAR